MSQIALSMEMMMGFRFKMNKKCLKCNSDKPISEYYETQKVGVYFSTCKKCHKEYSKSRYLEKTSTLEGIEAERKRVREVYYRLYRKQNKTSNLKVITKLENSEIVKKINLVFDGDFNDITPLHSNSLCRIAYIGYLTKQGLRPCEITKKLNWKKHQVSHRKIKHNSLYKFNPDYRKKFNSLFENI